MATKSIFKNVEINTEEGAKAFLDAIEESREASKKLKRYDIDVHELKDEELKEFFKKVIL